MTNLQAVLRFGMVAAMYAAWPIEAQNPAASDQQGRQKLANYLDAIAENHLAARKQAMTQLRTPADADRRKAMIREKLLGLIGGLPERHGPVAVKTFGTTATDGFRIEKIAYEEACQASGSRPASISLTVARDDFPRSFWRRGMARPGRRSITVGARTWR